MTTRAHRVCTVLLAPAAALVAWATVRLIGDELVVSTGDGSVGPSEVGATALVGALAGWWIVHLLERRSTRPLFWWAFVGSTALSVSMIGPAWLADGASAVSLMALHLVVAVVVITGFASTLPAHRADVRARPAAR
jgi:hypothetical protein